MPRQRPCPSKARVNVVRRVAASRIELERSPTHEDRFNPERGKFASKKPQCKQSPPPRIHFSTQPIQRQSDRCLLRHFEPAATFVMPVGTLKSAAILPNRVATPPQCQESLTNADRVNYF